MNATDTSHLHFDAASLLSLELLPVSPEHVVASKLDDSN
jgi:hypothetical protein